MVLKPKHSKQLKKRRALRDAEKERRQPEIDFDTSAYTVYHRLEMTYPCLSFDIVREDQEQDTSKFTSLSLHMIAGAQTPGNVENNYIYVMKVDNIKPLKQENDEEAEKSGDESEDEAGDETADLPNLTSVKVIHKGCVNRLRNNRLSGKLFTATWSDKGKVFIYDLTTPIQAVADHRSIRTYTAQKVEPKPIFTFGGHLIEGYALDWAPLRPGSLATGDCKKNIHTWTMRATDWHVDQQPLVGHENSVEDIKWSPEDENILASCSVDKSVRIWDLRQQAAAKCVIKVLDSHKSDVNVIDWNNKCKNLIVSGGDDGIVKVWDYRFLQKNDKESFPVAQFDYHKKPITSVQWNPNDDTVIAVASEDDKLTLWDLAVEKDDEQEEADEMEVDTKKEPGEESSSDSSSSEEDEEDEEFKEDDKEDENDEAEDGVEYGELNFKKIPEQMLFLHQGQTEIKELHWHPQLNGVLLSTALNGINIFKTISA